MSRLLSRCLVVAGAGLLSLVSSAYAGEPTRVPEPGTLSLLGTAVVGLIIAGRFIRRR